MDPGDEDIPLSARGSPRPWWILFVAAGLTLVGVAAFLIFGGPSTVFTPVPTFASLQTHRDATIVGTVAYERSGVVISQIKQDCVDVVAAGGGTPQQLFCVPWQRSPVKEAALVWLSDGNLEVTSRDANHWRKVADIAAGAVVDASWSPPGESTSDVGPQGQIVESHVFLGTLTLSVVSGSHRRTLASISVPREYSFGEPSWSPTGTWFVLGDSVGRVLVVTTGATPSIRYLADGVAPAASNRVFARLRATTG
jgi:hypothetical protein